MQNLSEKDIIFKIQQGERFHAEINKKGGIIKVDRYVPMICITPFSLEARNDFQEDGKRLVGQKIDLLLQSFPITLHVNDFTPYPQDDITKEDGRKNLSTQKKQKEYYKILDALLTKIESLFTQAIIYIFQGADNNKEFFQIGSLSSENTNCAAVMKHLKKQFASIHIQNAKIEVASSEKIELCDLCKNVIEKHPYSIFLHIIIQDNYIDQETGEAYPLLIDDLSEAIKKTTTYNAAYYSRKVLGKRISRINFFAAEHDYTIKKVDTELYRLARGIDTLSYVNPVNFYQEKKKFFLKRNDSDPLFFYRQLKLDPFLFRKKLYQIPVDNIKNISIRQLYRNIIDTLAARIDLITSIGTESFLYNSLRYYGEPRESDIKLAQFLIEAPDLPTDEKDTIEAAECAQIFSDAIASYGFDCKVELSNKIVARAMVSNAKKIVFINKKATFSQCEINALIHHELEVHMATTINASNQPLQILTLGLPGNTETQEGIAILCEYLSGNLTVQRLKGLAYRVIAVRLMVEGSQFKKTYKTLHFDYGLSSDEAFGLTTRVYRGGGFTKDYLYLSGLQKILNLYYSNIHLDVLFSGKTSLEFLDVLKEMLDQKIINPPSFIPPIWKNSVSSNPIIEYLLRAIK